MRHLGVSITVDHVKMKILKNIWNIEKRSSHKPSLKIESHKRFNWEM